MKRRIFRKCLRNLCVASLSDISTTLPVEINYDAKCPARLFHTREETICKVGCEKYECTCGCRFKWQDAFHWKVTRPVNAERGRFVR